jgi:hypothetical protein
MSIDKNNEQELDHFIDALRTQTITANEVARLDERLRNDADFRRLYRARMRMESNLLSVYQVEQASIVPPVMNQNAGGNPRGWWHMAAGAGIAAVVILSLSIFFQNPESPITPTVARIEVQNDASWVGMLPLNEKGELGKGEIYLKTGVAEIQFVSGVTISLEAPVRLDLIDAMRCRLLEGNIVVEVPDGAEGFIVDTPEGHAVDYGTNFAVTVNGENNTTEFGVISGEIAVHHKATKSSKTLLTGKAARLTAGGIVSINSPFKKALGIQNGSDFIRLRTNGRETSIVRNDQRDQWLSPDLLMVKADVRLKDESSLRPILIPKDRRSLIGFNLGEIDKQRIHSAKLRLNIVPSGLGFASFLPETSHFEIYGIKDKPDLESWWKDSLNWNDAPGSLENNAIIDNSEVHLLGTFEIPKGLLEGSINFSTDRLVKYIEQDTTNEIGFLIVMTTIPKKEWSLVHAFASSSHNGAAGPTLDIEYDELEVE